MASRTSPTVRRRRLASEMRRLRRESGKTREEAARFADIAPATVSRIEAAVHAPKVADIMALCKFYGLDDERTDVLVTLARQSRQRGWWHQYSGTIPEWFEVYVGLEEEASEILTYESEHVPGLFQTDDYIEALLNAGCTHCLRTRSTVESPCGSRGRSASLATTRRRSGQCSTRQ